MKLPSTSRFSRRFVRAALIAVLIAGGGCTASRGRLVLPAVGPAELPAPTPPSATAPAVGTLVVYSALDPNAPLLESGESRRHSEFFLAADGSAVWRQQPNGSGSTWEGPVPVILAPGRYRIRARANGYGEVTIPVVISEGRTTEVHLEGGEDSNRPGSVDARSRVTLPDGRVVGWRATAVPP